VGRGEKNYYGVLTLLGGVKTPFFYVSLPIERGSRLGKKIFAIALERVTFLYFVKNGR
jgi:hypothetical protein